MKLSVLHRTTHFRGDHAADVAEAHEVSESETVGTLALRLLGPAEAPRLRDWIEIRAVKANCAEEAAAPKAGSKYEYVEGQPVALSPDYKPPPAPASEPLALLALKQRGGGGEAWLSS